MCAGALDPSFFIKERHDYSKELCIGHIRQCQDIVPRLKGARGVALIRPLGRGDTRSKENQMAICIGRAGRTHGTRVVTITVLCCLGIALYAGGAFAQAAGLEKIQHVIVIYQENWSFDGLYGKFPGADGIANAGERIRQMKQDGRPYTTLPQPLDTSKQPPVPDPRFPANLPVAPYDAARYVPADQKTGDIEGISWAWYSEGWNDAVAGRPDALFQFHHQPFNYFAPYAEGTATRVEHLK